MIDLNSVVKPRPGVFATSVDTDLVVFDPDQGTYFGAGVVGERIWSLITDGKQVDALCDELVEQFAVDRATCEAEVCAFLRDLAERNLITTA